MNKNIKVYAEDNFTVYRGTPSSGKTSILVGRAIQLKNFGMRVLWMTADPGRENLCEIVDRYEFIRSLDELRSLMSTPDFQTYDVIIFDEIGKLSGFEHTTKIISDFRRRSIREGQIRMCSSTIRFND